MILRAIRLILFGAVFFAGAATAQDSSLTSGRLVRFEALGDPHLRTARVDLATRDSLIIRECVDCARRRYSLNELKRLEVLRRSGRGPFAGAITGGVLGLVSGAVVGATVGAIADAHQNCHQECWHGFATAVGIVVFGGTGAVVGTFVGAFKGADHWRSVLPPPVAILADSSTAFRRRFGNLPPTEFIFPVDSFSGNGKLSAEDTRKLELTAAEYARKVELGDRRITGFDPFRRDPRDTARIFRVDSHAKELAKELRVPIVNSDTLFEDCPQKNVCGLKAAASIITIGPASVNETGDKATVTVNVLTATPGGRNLTYSVGSSMRFVKRGKRWVHVPGGSYGIT